MASTLQETFSLDASHLHPGEPIGILELPDPRMLGPSAKRRWIEEAGTCPSITYPSTTAV